MSRVYCSYFKLKQNSRKHILSDIVLSENYTNTQNSTYFINICKFYNNYNTIKLKQLCNLINNLKGNTLFFLGFGLNYLKFVVNL